jgi:sterol 3beta-glucosyltransferase
MLQPFVAVGLKLKEYGHRVRMASHAPHREFVEQFGLEFYPLGGDPGVLADFAVQSKGLALRLIPAVFQHKSTIQVPWS